MDNQGSVRSSLLWLLRGIPTPMFLQRRLIRMLIPKRKGLKLIRLGPKGDGGYIVPDLMDGVEMCFSPGVDYHWGFESDLWEKYKIPSVLCDGSMDRPKTLETQHKYERTWIGKKTKMGSTSLHDWVKRNSASVERDFILQMDIEGSEYAVIRSTPGTTLRSFRIIVIEFHGFQTVQHFVDYLFKLHPAIRKLNREFSCVHIHPNNCSTTFSVSGALIPMVFEATFLRNDFYESVVLSESSVPEGSMPEDYDCVPQNPPIRLGLDWPKFS